VVEGRVIETQKDALVRLLSHYLVHLGKSISLLKSTCDESVLVSTAKRPVEQARHIHLARGISVIRIRRYKGDFALPKRDSVMQRLH